MKQITFRLKAGQLFKEEIERIAIEKNITAGVLLSVVGALDKAFLRMAGAEPNNQVIKEYNGPLEIVSGTGTISKSGCHIHIAVSNKEGNVTGGHLKDGCIVGVTAEIVIGIFEDANYQRLPDETTGFKELYVE